MQPVTLTSAQDRLHERITMFEGANPGVAQNLLNDARNSSFQLRSEAENPLHGNLATDGVFQQWLAVWDNAAQQLNAQINPAAPGGQRLLDGVNAFNGALLTVGARPPHG
ncbi:hypothetical protein [Streptomyces sp. 900105245]